MFKATHKQTGIEFRGIPQDAEAYVLNTSLWCAAAQIASLVDVPQYLGDVTLKVADRRVDLRQGQPKSMHAR